MFASILARAARLTESALTTTRRRLAEATTLSFDIPAISLQEVESDLLEGTA